MVENEHRFDLTNWNNEQMFLKINISSKILLVYAQLYTHSFLGSPKPSGHSGHKLLAVLLSHSFLVNDQ